LSDVVNQSKGRYFYIDVWRGIAVALMIVFHFTYDLSHFQYLDIDFDREPFWLNFRIVIVTLFLCLVGISLQLATGHGITPSRYYKRLGRLVGAATLVSIGSYIVFPDSFIYFGVLHFVVVASVLGLLFRNLFWLNLISGVAIIVIGIQFYAGLFESPLWYWTGLMSGRPYSEDYVPLLPWFGVVLIGMFTGLLIEKYGLLDVDNRGEGALTRALAWGGRHSLLIYLLHQPLLFGGFYLVIYLMPSN